MTLRKPDKLDYWINIYKSNFWSANGPVVYFSLYIVTTYVELTQMRQCVRSEMCNCCRGINENIASAVSVRRVVHDELVAV